MERLHRVWKYCSELTRKYGTITLCVEVCSESTRKYDYTACGMTCLYRIITLQLIMRELTMGERMKGTQSVHRLFYNGGSSTIGYMPGYRHLSTIHPSTHSSRPTIYAYTNTNIIVVLCVISSVAESVRT